MLHQLPGLAGQTFALVGEGSGEQACRVKGLHQVMADGGEEAGFRLVGRLGNAFGIGQRDIELRQFMGAFGDPLFQAFIGLGQSLFGLAEAVMSVKLMSNHHQAASGCRSSSSITRPMEQPF